MHRIKRVAEHLSIAPTSASADQLPALAPNTAVVRLSDGTPTSPNVRQFDELPGPWKDITKLEELFAAGRKAEMSAHFRKWHLEYGDIFRYRSLRPSQRDELVDVVVISDPDLITQLYQNHIPKDDNYNLFLLLGEGVLSSTNYDEWKLQRELLKPAFSVETLKKLQPGMVESIQKLIETLKAVASSNQPVDLMTELPKLTFEIIAHAAIGEDAKHLHKNGEDLREAFDTVTIKPFQGVTPDVDPEYKAAYDYMTKFADDVLARAESKEAVSKCPVHRPSPQGASILDIIRTTDENGKPILRRKLQLDSIFTTLFAGHETTANTLGMLFAELSKRPQLNKDLYHSIVNSPEFITASEKAKIAFPASEINEAYQFLSYSDLLRFDLVTKFLNETMRRWPVVASGTFRVIDHDYVIGGYFIPKGTLVRTPHLNVHLNPRIWDNPLEFNPYRKWHASAFIPFSKGDRDCLGRNLAMLEMRLVVIALMSNFEFINAKPEKPLRFFERLTIKHRGPLTVHVKTT